LTGYIGSKVTGARVIIRRKYWNLCRIKGYIIEEKRESLFGGMVKLLNR